MEWPTVVLWVVIIMSWLFLTFHFVAIPGWVLFILGGAVAGWHASYQHEVTHGHPTGNALVNAWMAGPSLLLWLPYRMFRREHLRHHDDARLTDPLSDPESFYVLERDWRLMNSARRGLLIANNTLAGRLVLGPALVVSAVLWRQAWLLGRGGKDALLDWLTHVPGLILVFGWLNFVAEVPLWVYVLCFSYPGTALLLLRSYTEHRPATCQSKRTVIVEAGPILSLLFLNNNLHAVHHDRPSLPWYRLPVAYRTAREEVLARNGGFQFDGYREIARRFLFQVKDHPVHPTRQPIQR
ncbi:MAG: fatty acid desaturase [Alphaproteobacteria bacterium]|nr:fatty acid desaturase [Alphaproteobacteria bacterium]